MPRPCLLARMLAFVLAASALAACAAPAPRPRTPAEPNPAPAQPSGPAIRVVASFYPYGELVRAVAGARAEVHTLVPDGAEPHHWEPRPSDVARLRQADLIVYNGAGLEPWLPDVLAGLPADRPRRLEAAAGLGLLPAPEPAVEEEEGHDHGHDHRHGAEAAPDPHIWLDPVLLQDVVARLRDALTAADPAGAATYGEAAAALSSALAELDRQYREALASCRHRTLLVTHGFFTYPAARYGLEQLAVMGVAPGAEPSPRTLARLAELARNRGVGVLFAETLVGRRVAETLAAEAGLQVRRLNPMEGLTPEERARGVTLLDLFRANLEELRAGLECGG